MPTMDDEKEKGIFNGDLLEEALYHQMRTSFVAAVEGQDLHPAVERAIMHLYLGETRQDRVADAFKKYMSKSDGDNIVLVAMKDWKENCKEALKTFAKQNKAKKIEGNRYRDYWK